MWQTDSRQTDRQTDRLAKNTMWLQAACFLQQQSATHFDSSLYPIQSWLTISLRPSVHSAVPTRPPAVNVTDASFSSVCPRISSTHFLLRNLVSVILCLKKCIFEVFTLPRCCTTYVGSYRRFGSTDGPQIQGSRCPRRMSGSGGSVIRKERTVIGWQGM